jgi:hypothetical protein
MGFGAFFAITLSYNAAAQANGSCHSQECNPFLQQFPIAAQEL